jgi:hypothetical protein
MPVKSALLTPALVLFLPTEASYAQEKSISHEGHSEMRAANQERHVTR